MTETPARDRIEPVDLQQEMQRSYIDYAMSVIVGRALPDVRDGLKPVHRRVLYAMFDQGFRPDRATVKCARVVGVDLLERARRRVHRGLAQLLGVHLAEALEARDLRADLRRVEDSRP